MKKNRGIGNWLLLAVILGMSFLAGCGQKPQIHEKKIGFVVPNLSNPFYVDMMAGAKNEIEKHPGYILHVQATEKNSDIERQIQLIENLIVQKVDALCVVPCNSKSIVTAVKKANNAKIPFVDVDVKFDSNKLREMNSKITAFVGSDNFQGGKMAGEFVVKKLQGMGIVAILEGMSGVEAGINRKAGFLEAMKGAPGIKVVVSLPADWEREKGMNVFEGIVRAHPELDAVFACNDEMILGALRVKTQKKILLVGFDAMQEAREAVASGKLDATVAQQPYEMGVIAIAQAIKILEKRPFESKIETPLKLITKE